MIPYLPDMTLAHKLGWVRPAPPQPPVKRPTSRPTKYPELRGLDSQSSAYQAAYRAMVKAKRSGSRGIGETAALSLRPHREPQK